MLRWALVWLAILLQPWKWGAAFAIARRMWAIRRRIREHQRHALRHWQEGASS